MTQEELFAGNALIIEFDEHSNFHNYTSSKQGYLMDTIRYEDSWDLLHQVIDKINGMGKEYNFALFKTYVSLSIEKDSKFFKDFHFAHSENITSEQSGKEAVFKTLVKFIKWNRDNKITS